MHTHGELLAESARAGKAVLCEKPIEVDLAKAQAAAEQVRAAGVPAATGLNRRFAEEFRSLGEVVREERIGKLEMLLITSRSAQPPATKDVRLSGGRLREKGSHFFDLACWIAGEYPREV